MATSTVAGMGPPVWPAVHPVRPTVFDRIFGGALIGFTRFVTGANARWVGIDRAETQRVYFANHTSHADFIVVWAALAPRLRSKTSVVAAADYWKRGKIRRYLAERVFHAILVQREHIHRVNNPLVQLTRAIDCGQSLILFPEGTRGRGEALHPFKCGIYHLARARPDVDLVPVWIDNLYRVLPKGAIVPAPLECSVTFGEPLRIERGEGKEAFLERMHQALNVLGQSCPTNCI
jgi:1-acyl-sn-glycerol-3-phosphate acyltransferase